MDESLIVSPDNIDDEYDDVVYGDDGMPLDVISPSWLVPETSEPISVAPSPAPPAPAEQLLTAQQAAGWVGCHSNTIYGAAKAGVLRSRRIGRLVRFTRHDLDAWTRGEGR
jgi:excisionase family DNA binding protein